VTESLTNQLIRGADGLKGDNSLFYCDLEWYVSRLQRITVTTIKLHVQHLVTHAFAFCYQQPRETLSLIDCQIVVLR